MLRYPFRLLRDTVCLDPYDLNYQLSSEEVDLLEYSPRYKARGLFGGAGRFIRELVYEVRQGGLELPPPLPPKTALFFAATRNQLDALKPLLREMPEARLLTAGLQEGLRYPLLWAYLAALPFLPLVYLRALTAKGYHQKAHQYIFHLYWLSYGYYLVSRPLLRRLRPGLIVMSNDHSLYARALLRAAQAEGIATAYVQHASVTEHFPPLSFEYAFLEGKDALEKYKKAGTEQRTRIFLCGIAKFDAFHGQENKRERVESLAVCVNPPDSLERVASLCEGLRAAFPDLKLMLRLHPGETRDFSELWRRYGLELSHAQTELSFAFLQRVDAVIAGGSNILLEAALLNLAVLYYDFEGVKRDLYGFIANDFCPYAESEKEVLAHVRAWLLDKPDTRTRTRPYCATVGTPYAGGSSRLIADLIRRVLAGERLPPEGWERLGGGLEAFRPAETETRLF